MYRTWRIYLRNLGSNAILEFNDRIATFKDTPTNNNHRVTYSASLPHISPEQNALS